MCSKTCKLDCKNLNIRNISNPFKVGDLFTVKDAFQKPVMLVTLIRQLANEQQKLRSI